MNRDDATLLAQDAETRRQAQIEFQRPLVLEAGAGTGKTTALVARILSWCLGEGWATKAAELAEDEELRKGVENEEDWIAARVLEGLVAITFTEAAAAEMAERTAQGLSQVAAGQEIEIAGFDPSLLPGPTGPAITRRATRPRSATRRRQAPSSVSVFSGTAPIATASFTSRAVRSRGAVEPVFVESLDGLEPVLANILEDGDLVLTMGAGDIGAYAARLPRLLGTQPNSEVKS